jgi:hypothetical protein
VPIRRPSAHRCAPFGLRLDRHIASVTLAARIDLTYPVAGSGREARRRVGLGQRTRRPSAGVAGRATIAGRRALTESVECHLPPTMLLAVAVRRYVLFGGFGCVVDGTRLVVGGQMRLIRRRQNVFGLVKLGGFAVVPCRVLMMLGRKLMESAQR